MHFKKTRAVKSDCDFFLVPYGVFCEILIPMRRLGEWVLLRNSRRLALGQMDGLIVARTYLSRNEGCWWYRRRSQRSTTRSGALEELWKVNSFRENFMRLGH